MKHGRKMLVWILGCLVSGACANAITADNPFQSIVDRNVFGLKAPPPPPAPPEPPKPPLPPIALTGIMTGLGKKRALMETMLPAKPPDQPKKSYPTLGEGERDGEIEVLKIDEKAGSVEVNFFGVRTNLTFGAKLPVAPPLAAPPGQPIPGIPSPMNAGINPAQMQPSGGMNRTLPGRPMRLSPNEGAGSPTLPMGGNPGFQDSANSGVKSPLDGLSHEEYALVVEAERERTKNDVLSGKLAPMPPTKYTPKGAVGTYDDTIDPNAIQRPQ